MTLTNSSEKVEEVTNLANHFLEFSSINWKLALDLYNNLKNYEGSEELAFKIISRAIEIKPIFKYY